MKVVLFLCTGNYYRSRYAEEMFNLIAPAECPGWTAVSRGIAVDLGANNVAPNHRSDSKGSSETGCELQSPACADAIAAGDCRS